MTSFADLLTIVSVLGISGAVFGGAAAWVAKAVIGHGFARNLETHKAALLSDLERQKAELSGQIEDKKADAQKSFEAYKRQLDAADLETNKARIMLVERRAQIVADLYRHIVGMNNAVGALVNVAQWVPKDPDEAKKRETDRHNLAADAFNNCTLFFGIHQIYFSDELCQRVDKLLSETKRSFMEYNVAKHPGRQNEDTELWVTAYERMNVEVPSILLDLKTEFRKILAVTKT